MKSSTYFLLSCVTLLVAAISTTRWPVAANLWGQLSLWYLGAAIYHQKEPK